MFSRISASAFVYFKLCVEGRYSIGAFIRGRRLLLSTCDGNKRGPIAPIFSVGLQLFKFIWCQLAPSANAFHGPWYELTLNFNFWPPTFQSSEPNGLHFLRPYFQHWSCDFLVSCDFLMSCDFLVSCDFLESCDFLVS